jgi:hypothetical protein
MAPSISILAISDAESSPAPTRQVPDLNSPLESSEGVSDEPDLANA